MAFFTALSAIAAVGGALSARQQQMKAAAVAKAAAKKQETKAREAAAMRAPVEQEVRTKIGVSDAATPTALNSDKRGTSVRDTSNGLGGVAVSASKIGGL